MESKCKQMREANASAERLTDEALTKAAGGVGYSAIQCKKCGKSFADMEQYRLHVEAGCRPKVRC